MLFCTGVSKKKDKGLIFDTTDSVTEVVSYKQLQEYRKLGVVIANITLDNGCIQITESSTINNKLEEFKQKGNMQLTNLFLLTQDVDKQKQSLTKIACRLGLIANGETLTVNIETGQVIFPWQGFIYTFRGDGAGNKVEKIDVCDMRVATLSKLGFEAFKYMLLNIGTKAEPNWVNLHECFEELRLYSGVFDEVHITYIGITPSNKMFKIYTLGDVYSVHFTTKEVVSEKLNNILKLKTTDSRFKDYLHKIKSKKPNSICIDKVSLKSYNSLSKVKAKYPTLQLVYEK